jgi:ATP-binding dynein motor region
MKQIYSPQGIVMSSIYRQDYLHQIENCKNKKLPLLLTDLSENFPEDLMKVLRENSKENQRKHLNIILAASVTRPNFSAEVFTLSNIVDFTVTSAGIEEMFL